MEGRTLESQALEGRALERRALEDDVEGLALEGALGGAGTA